MDKKETLALIVQKNRNERRSTRYVNSLKEDFYFSDWVIQKMNRLIAPVQAGVTHPDPDYFCHPPKDDVVAPHLYVLEYVVKGKGYIVSGGKTYPVSAGDTYLLSPAAGKRWYADPNDPYEKKWVNVSGRFVESLVSAYGMQEPLYIAPIDTEAQLDEIHAILLEYDPQNTGAADLRLMHLLLDVFDRFREHRQSPDVKPDKAIFREILEYISANLYYKPMSAATVSYQFFISERTLTRMFEKNLGVTPAKYILAQRVEYAQRLLCSTRHSVERIAEMTFFSSPRHFRTVFRSFTGELPTEWRKQHAGIEPPAK